MKKYKATIIEDITSSLKNSFILKFGLPNIPKLNNKEREIYCGITRL